MLASILTNHPSNSFFLIMSQLFSPITIGSLELPNRILMAPLTRCRADSDHVPGPLMAEYYSQRASAGLLIAEATMVMEGNSSFWMEPGIYSDAQVEGWKLTTDAVHAAGGRIFLQIWHGGRACHPLLNGGAQPVAPSPIPITGVVETLVTPWGRASWGGDGTRSVIFPARMVQNWRTYAVRVDDPQALDRLATQADEMLLEGCAVSVTTALAAAQSFSAERARGGVAEAAAFARDCIE